MRFVTPEVVRIDLDSVQADGKTKEWVEIKKELSKAEDTRYRGRGFKRMSSSAAPADEGRGNDIEVDWEAMALARVEAYLVDWSAKKPNGKDLPVTRQAIGQLDTASFDQIDKAIQAHVEALEEEKKLRNGNSSATPPVPS